MSGIWVLAADSNRARLFRAESPTGPLAEVEDLVNPAVRLTDRELVSDAPGRVISSADKVSSHAYGADYSEHERVKDSFARELAGKLDKLRSNGGVDAFYLLAEPGFMGAMRNHCSKPIKELIYQEVLHRATGESPEAIRRRLPKRLGPMR